LIVYLIYCSYLEFLIGTFDVAAAWAKIYFTDTVLNTVAIVQEYAPICFGGSSVVDGGIEFNNFTVIDTFDRPFIVSGNNTRLYDITGSMYVFNNYGCTMDTGNYTIDVNVTCNS